MHKTHTHPLKIPQDKVKQLSNMSKHAELKRIKALGKNREQHDLNTTRSRREGLNYCGINMSQIAKKEEDK